MDDSARIPTFNARRDCEIWEVRETRERVVNHLWNRKKMLKAATVSTRNGELIFTALIGRSRPGGVFRRMKRKCVKTLSGVRGSGSSLAKVKQASECRLSSAPSQKPCKHKFPPNTGELVCIYCGETYEPKAGTNVFLRMSCNTFRVTFL